MTGIPGADGGGANVMALAKGGLGKVLQPKATKVSPFAPQDWESTTSRRLTWKDDGSGQLVPVLTVYDLGGGKTTQLTGQEALAYASPQDNPAYTREILTARQAVGKTRKDDSLVDSKYYRSGKKFGEWLRGPKTSIAGKIFNHPLSGFGVGGLLGYGAGKLGEIAETMITGNDRPSMAYSTMGMLGGGTIGGMVGHSRKQTHDYIDRQNSGMDKGGSVIRKSAMYTDPRNFILERLSSATDISPLEKAQLAARVRSMNTAQAEALKSMVRGAMGFGVGALIARFLGFSLGGTGVMGGIGAIAGALSPGGNRQASGIFGPGNYF